MKGAAWSVAVTAAILFLTLVDVSAQWLDYPAPGVPDRGTGSPNLNAPPPRTAAGKPDFSGMWQPKGDIPCPPDGCPDNQLGQQFFDIGWGLKGSR